MDKYFMLMGDIKDSRKYDQKILSETLNRILIETEENFRDKIITKLEIKVGDDFQVVVKDIKILLSILLYLDIAFMLENIECRFALGYGNIYGNINKTTHSEIMGMGLTNTNEILNKKNKKYSFYIQNDIDKTILLNTIGMLMEEVFSSFTDKQKIFLKFKVIKNKDLKEIKSLMKTSERSIYYFAERSKYFFIMNVFEQIILSFETNSNKLDQNYFKDIKFDEEL
ncbi:SatD family protein [Arcobacter sp. F2176]|uniref:SatD family protein n=1 Tax=Arcobacter sp. F2176 TaxID=2044511 RepID=UPI00100B53F6|nr:SatD family protein [Arcobacter sp. F2176]RXJ78318.1 hypothetical protein CRU95_15695 [Arcobacter sp. F2176]